MPLPNEKKESQFIEERVKDFQKKMLELKNADDFQEGGESGIYDFGYKMKFGDTIYTITDWKGMEKNFRQSLELQRERIVEKLVDKRGRLFGYDDSFLVQGLDEAIEIIKEL